MGPPDFLTFGLATRWHESDHGTMSDSRRFAPLAVWVLGLALVGVVLLQRSEGGALGIGGGGGFMTGRGQANALSRATAILGALFFATSLIMSMIAGWNRAPRSIVAPTPSSTSAPAGNATSCPL